MSDRFRDHRPRPHPAPGCPQRVQNYAAVASALLRPLLLQGQVLRLLDENIEWRADRGHHDCRAVVGNVDPATGRFFPHLDHVCPVCLICYRRCEAAVIQPRPSPREQGETGRGRVRGWLICYAIEANPPAPHLTSPRKRGEGRQACLQSD